MKMCDNNQKAKIHIAKAELGLSRDQYEGLLIPYGVTSSKDLTYKQADSLLETMKGMGWKPKRRKVNDSQNKGWGKNKYEYLRPRPSDMADPVQLRLAEVLWRIVARNPSDAALRQMNHRINGVKNLVWLTKPQISALLCAEQEMYKKLSQDHIKDRESLLKPWQQELLRNNVNEIIHMS